MVQGPSEPTGKATAQRDQLLVLLDQAVGIIGREIEAHQKGMGRGRSPKQPEQILVEVKKIRLTIDERKQQ